MDWWLILKIIWGGVGLGLIGMLLIVAWRARGVMAWNRSIRNELKALAIDAQGASPARKKAIGLVIAECEHTLGTFEPERAVDLNRLRTFIRSIAACFFPEARQPELQISLGRLIKSIDAFLDRFDRIIQRPGLRRISTISIGSIRSLHRWSNGLLERPWVRWYVAHRTKVQRFALIRLFIVPDPLSWLLYLSRKLMLLVLIRNLLVDITLFVGRLAMDAFDSEGAGPAEGYSGSLESALEDLSRAEMAAVAENDPEIADIRQQLVGFSAVIVSNPTWQDCRSAVKKAAGVLARRHFPYSDHPLEEAAIGPLLLCTRSWLATLGKGSNIAIVRYAYKLRLDTLFQAKDISDLVFTTTVRGIVRGSLAAFGWLKWPLKIYRRVKRFSLPGIAADVGWVLAKKSALALIYGSAFDQACRHLDWVYRASSGRGTPAVQTPPGESPAVAD